MATNQRQAEISAQIHIMHDILWGGLFSDCISLLSHNNSSIRNTPNLEGYKELSMCHLHLNTPLYLC